MTGKTEPNTPVRILGVLAVMTFLISATPRPDDEQIAAVEQIDGSAAAVQNAQFRQLAVNAPIFLHDVVSTGSASRLKFKMTDGTEFTLGSKTNFVVEEYILRPDENSIVTKLLGGSIRALTGEITKSRNAEFRMETAAGIIGVRGTEFISYRDGPVSRVIMLGGKGVTMENGAGRAEITKPCQAIEVASENGAPVNKGAIKAALVKKAISATFTAADFSKVSRNDFASLRQDLSDKKVYFRSRPPVGETGPSTKKVTKERPLFSYCAN